MGSKEDAGRGRGRTIGREYKRAYDELMEIVRKDEEDETRKRSDHSSGPQAGADIAPDQSGVRGPAGEPRRPGESGREDAPRSRANAPDEHQQFHSSKR